MMAAPLFSRSLRMLSRLNVSRVLASACSLLGLKDRDRPLTLSYVLAVCEAESSSIVHHWTPIGDSKKGK